MKRILYIGNKLNNQNNTITSIDTLGNLLKKEGYKVKAVSDKKNKVFRFFDMCYAVLKHRKKIDIILIDTYSTLNFYYALGVSIIARLINIPYIPILRGGNLPQRLLKDKKKSAFLFKNSKINLAPSLYLETFFKQNGFENTVTIPNSIELNNYRFKLKKPTRKILWVRSFSQIYNPMLSLKVIEQLAPKYPEISLCMVGPEKDSSLKECKEYALFKKLPVTFTGKLSKEEWIKLSENFSIFINTTNFDNTPISVIEAMALGLTVVSTRVGGIPFLLEDRKDALLVPPDSVKAFVEALEELFATTELSYFLTQNARKKAENFDWEVVKFKWFEILD